MIRTELFTEEGKILTQAGSFDEKWKYERFGRSRREVV